MALEIASSIVSIVSSVAVFFTKSIGRQIGYVFNYNSNVEDMKAEVNKLTRVKGRVQKDVDLAIRNVEEVYEDVEEWLTDVNGVTGEAGRIVNDTEDIAKTRCFMGWCPNLITRYQLSREAEKKTQAAIKLREERKSEKVSHPKPPQVEWRVKEFESFESRASVLKNVVEALKDADVYLIGVYGMAGVGKTTLVKEVRSRVKEEGIIFKSVVMTTVTHSPDLKEIQQAIADWLDFPINVGTIDVRAARLSERLKMEEKILIILDDVWKGFKLEEVGIPCGNDHKGCKILMTSRDQNVFMELHVQRDFRLQILEDEEAWNLFQKTAGEFKDSRIQPVAIEVAKKCAGLPILIVTVASALKDRGLSEWSDAIEKLRRFDNQGIDATTYKALELSYDFLDDEEKSLFRLCGQLSPHIIPILDLLKYCMGLGLFNQLTTVKTTRNRLLKVVNDLKRRCLLLEGNNDDNVKMHDVVHKFAASVATKDDSIFTVPYGAELEEWPENDTLKQCTAIALSDCKHLPKFPEVFECSKVKSFILYSGNVSLEIPDNLFREMKELKLLDLTSLKFSSTLPTSLQFLENLQTLCLDHCSLEDITIIGELKKLLVLSFIASTIDHLPKQLENLTRLRLLDLSRCQRLQVIPAGVLSCLTRLEELYVGDSFIQWEIEDHNGTSQNNVKLDELKFLSNLVALEMQVIDAEMLPEQLFSEKLERFKIFIGEEWIWDRSSKYETWKTLKLQTDTSIQLERVKVLLMRTEDLYLNEMKGVKSVLYDLNEEGFPELKHLHVRNSPDIQYIMDCVRMGTTHVGFPKLESLYLDYLISLENMCHGAIKAESFGSLTKLNVQSCDRLKNLLSFSMARSLLKLQEINVSSCKIMEEIVAKDTGDKYEELKWTQLCSLTLYDLPHLSCFMSQMKKVPSVVGTSASSNEIVLEDEPETPVPLFNTKITFPNLTDLKMSSIGVEKIWSNQLPQCIQKLTALIIDGCGNLKYLFTYSMIESLSNLKKLEICDCKSMEEVISVENTTVQNWFDELKFLKLKNVKKLINFCRGNSIECPNLRVLQIEDCPQLKTFISNIGMTDGASDDQSGQTNSTLFDEKIVFPKLEEVHIMDMHKLALLWHNEFEADSLKVLKVEHANQLLKIFPERGFKNLESLVVNNCDMIEEVFDDLKVAPIQLRSLELKDLPNLKHVWKWNTEDHNGAVSFDKLSSVIVSDCMSLKCLFPISVARNLQALDDLGIDDCGLEEIVSKEEISEATPKFVFPQLKSFSLWRLKELKCFYSGNHTLECPMLQRLRVCQCDRLNIFDFEETDEENRVTIQVHHQSLFSFSKVVPQLVELGLNSNDATILIRIQSQFPKLKILHLQCFYDISANFPFHLLRMFPNVVNLVLTNCDFQEIFPCGIAIEDVIAVSRIRFLTVADLPEIRRIWNQDCQFISDLQSIEIWGCDKLINLGLGPSSANLTSLDVCSCEGLINLVTTSAAKGMVNLTIMKVRECNMVTEIVAKEGDECQSQSEVIIFKKLKTLKLVRLRSLSSFSPSPNCKIKFPSLEEVVVTECPKMQVFSQGLVSTPQLQKVCLAEGGDKWRWMKDLNTTIRELYTEMVGFDGIQQLELSEFPLLEKVWNDKSLPCNFFMRLRKLVVNEYGISSVAVPSNLLPFLNDLEEFDVINCDSVEEVFDPECPNVSGQSGHLAKIEADLE